MKRLVTIILWLALLLISGTAFAAGGVVKGPNEIAPDRYVYYPGTEVLAKDEVRAIACGTGMGKSGTAWQNQPPGYQAEPEAP